MTYTVGVVDSTVGNNVNVTFAQVPANQHATVTVTAKVKNVLGNVDGVVKSNTAAYTWAKTSGGRCWSPLRRG